MTLHSALYEGTIRHRRFKPVDHTFSYRVFMVYLDLDEADRVFALHPLWSLERTNLCSMRRADYAGPPDVPLKEYLADLVRAHTGWRPDGPIRMLTHLRYYGHTFNPVTFYYCFRHGEEDANVIVAEITNTPWGQRRLYVLHEGLNAGSAHKKHYRFQKDFHISPFMAMDMEYGWRFITPSSSLSVHMDVLKEGGTFDATLSLRRTELSLASMTRVLLVHPLLTMKVVAGVYWQALLLHLKKSSYFPHPHSETGAGHDGLHHDAPAAKPAVPHASRGAPGGAGSAVHAPGPD